MRFLLTIFIFLTAISTQAALYKYKDENGEVVYSEEPPYEGAKEFILPGLQTTPAVKPKPKPKSKPEPEEVDKPTKYTLFQITSPTNEQSLHNSAGNVSISLAIAPNLNTKAGHYINILLDGKIIKKKTTSLSGNFQHIDRGSHSIKAELRDQSSKLIKSSNTVTIHVHRFSKQHKKPER